MRRNGKTFSSFSPKSFACEMRQRGAGKWNESSSSRSIKLQLSRGRNSNRRNLEKLLSQGKFVFPVETYKSDTKWKRKPWKNITERWNNKPMNKGWNYDFDDNIKEQNSSVDFFIKDTKGKMFMKRKTWKRYSLIWSWKPSLNTNESLWKAGQHMIKGIFLLHQQKLFLSRATSERKKQKEGCKTYPHTQPEPHGILRYLLKCMEIYRHAIHKRTISLSFHS